MDRLSSLVWLFGLPSLLALVTWRTVSCPYTKVEESFTLQAVHDILSYGTSPQALAKYDHHVFPGAVPRSFVGPLLLAAISYPFLLFSRFIGAVNTSADAQVVIRLCLAAANVTTIAFFCQQMFFDSRAPAATGKRPSKPRDDELPAGLFLVLTAVQFHYAFWTSRTIPNSLALPFVLTALALICRNIGTPHKGKRSISEIKVAIWLLTFSAVVLRLEIVAIIIPVGLYLSATRTIRRWTGFKTGIVSGAFSLLLTTTIDTYFWQDLADSKAKGIFDVFASSLRESTNTYRAYPLWPELHALLFNVVEGKSSEWGVSPWHAYITSLIPKLLAFTTPLVVMGAAQLFRRRGTFLEAKARFLLLTAVMHTAILSMLGHKEWRFVFYILPALNVAAAIGASKLGRCWPGRIALAALLLLQIGLSWFTGHLSSINYPGGEALRILHQQVHSSSEGAADDGRVVVHISVLPAMTGVTRFQSLYADRTPSQRWIDRLSAVVPASCESDQCWVYDKTEDLPISGLEAVRTWPSFTHLITEVPECRILHDQQGKALTGPVQLFEPLAPPISSFAGLRRKTISQIKTDLLSLPRIITSALRRSDTPPKHSTSSLMQLALPLVVVEQPSVWLCRRKDNSV